MFYSTCDLVSVIAEKCAQGSYQLDCAQGLARASGSDLVGNARHYSGRYRESREAWLSRVEAAGVYVAERRIGTRLFVILAIDEADAEEVGDDELMRMWV